jgi:hypothetical protein
MREGSIAATKSLAANAGSRTKSAGSTMTTWAPRALSKDDVVRTSSAQHSFSFPKASTTRAASSRGKRVHTIMARRPSNEPPACCEVGSALRRRYVPGSRHSLDPASTTDGRRTSQVSPLRRHTHVCSCSPDTSKVAGVPGVGARSGAAGELSHANVNSMVTVTTFDAVRRKSIILSLMGGSAPDC